MENIIRKVYKNIVKVQYDTRLNSVSNGIALCKSLFSVYYLLIIK